MRDKGDGRWRRGQRHNTVMQLKFILQTRKDEKEQKYSTRADLAVLQKSIYYTFQRCFLVEGRRKGEMPFKLMFKWLNAWVMLSNRAN